VTARARLLRAGTHVHTSKVTALASGLQESRPLAGEPDSRDVSKLEPAQRGASAPSLSVPRG
jgi:hypothetical protein